MGMGAVIYVDGVEIARHSCFVPAARLNSNNVAEYSAFIWILNTLLEKGLHEKIKIIYGDSKLVIEQMFGTWRIKNGMYVKFAKEAKELLKKFKNTSGQWIPRHMNFYADELSKAELVKNNVEFKIQPQ